MRAHVLLYGLLGGVLIAALQYVEYRWLVRTHSVEIYGGLVAAIFAGVGIWLGRRLTRSRAGGGARGAGAGRSPGSRGGAGRGPVPAGTPSCATSARSKPSD